MRRLTELQHCRKQRENKIKAIQRKLISDIPGTGDGFDQYVYLIELSSLLPPIDPAKKCDSHAVKGCQSHVWLDMRAENGVFRMDGDSDTFILKGILYLLRRMFNKQSLSAVASAEIRVFSETEITITFGADRQKGIGYILQAIQGFAKENERIAKKFNNYM